jgi:DNA-binding NarL/FixJ family response regulator
VVRVPSGAEGLKKLMASDFDVIVCDMVMPGFPGDMFYLAVSRTKPYLLKRFIFMTGFQGDRKIDEFIRRIRGVVLWKPFQFHEMMERIDAVLAKASAVVANRAA